MTTLTRGLLAVLATCSLIACGGDDSTPSRKLYGTTHGASQLLELDPTTGALVRTIGPVGYRVNGLEWDGTARKLYATTSDGDLTFPNGLIEIDLATGAGTPIGTGAGMYVNNPTVNSAGQLYAWSEDSDDLVTLDKTTGVATVVGDSGVSTYEHGLAFDRSGDLYFVNGDGEVYTIDTTTGLATSVGNIGQRAHHGDFHPGTGRYWGIDETNDSAATPARNLLVVDPDTGDIVDTLPTADNLMAITFR